MGMMILSFTVNASKLHRLQCAICETDLTYPNMGIVHVQTIGEHYPGSTLRSQGIHIIDYKGTVLHSCGWFDLRSGIITLPRTTYQPCHCKQCNQAINRQPKFQQTAQSPQTSDPTIMPTYPTGNHGSRLQPPQGPTGIK